MKDKDQDMGEVDGEEVFDFPPSERRIFTQPYDLSLDTLKEKWDKGELVVPEMQREYVWDLGRASRLIESLLLNIPVPPIYFAERPDSVLEVVDGHQRVGSIVKYLNNEFSLSGLGILSEYLRLRFHKLPEQEQRFLKSRSLRAVVIGRDSHPNMKFEVFERLNTGGIALNAQELRNSLYRGSLKRMLRRLARECESFRAVLGSSKPRKRMVDEELILRWLALRDKLKDYRPPLKRFLNEYMAENKDRGESWLGTRERHFRRTMESIESVLGDQAFRLIDESGEPLLDENGKPLPRGVNRALFDAQATAFGWIVTYSITDAQRLRLVKQRTATRPATDLLMEPELVPVERLDRAPASHSTCSDPILGHDWSGGGDPRLPLVIPQRLGRGTSKRGRGSRDCLVPGGTKQEPPRRATPRTRVRMPRLAQTPHYGGSQQRGARQ